MWQEGFCMERDLEYSYAVYKTGSFSKAAGLLYASQPAVSMAIQRVEEDLGYAIFDRQSHPLKLTEAGKLFIQHVERLRESEDQMRSGIDHLNNMDRSRLRIGCTPMHALYLLPGVLERMKDAAPELEISVWNSFPREMESYLREHRIDLAVNTMIDEAPLEFTYLPAFDVYYLLGVPEKMIPDTRLRDMGMTATDVVNGKFRDRSHPSFPVSLFSGLPFIDCLKGTEFYEQIRKIFSKSGLKPNSVITVSFPAMAHELAKRGLGATIVGHFSVAEDSPLLYYRMQTKLDKRSFFFISRREEELDKNHELFMRTFLEYLQDRDAGKE